MGDLISSVATAVNIAKRLKEYSDKIKELEFKNLLADLNLELAELKLKLAEVLEENIKQKEKIQALEAMDGDPCPKCRKRGWQLEASERDPIFGALGGVRRTYRCSFCGFSEEKLSTSD